MSQKIDPVEILDWLWDRNIMEGCCVYDDRGRYRDAYHGSTHKSRVAPKGYYYCVDTPELPGEVIVPTGGSVSALVEGDSVYLTLGFDASRYLTEHEGALRELADDLGAGAFRSNRPDTDVPDDLIELVF